MSVFAFVGRDRQIHLGDAANGRVWALTGSVPGNDRPWGALAARRDAWSWPTWSPDGAWIACFAAEESDEDSGPARIVALSTDGVREEVCWIENRFARCGKLVRNEDGEVWVVAEVYSSKQVNDLIIAHRAWRDFAEVLEK